MAPLTPSSRNAARLAAASQASLPRGQPCGERQAGQQGHGVEQMRRKRIRAVGRGVLAHVIQQHQRRAQKRFGDQEHR
jgi:hypothetical protein